MLTKTVNISILVGAFLIGCGATPKEDKVVSMPHQIDITPKNLRELDPLGEEYLNYMKTHNLNSVIFQLKDGSTKLNDFDNRDQNLNYVFYYDSDHNKETGYYDRWVSKAGADYLYENDVLYRYTGTPGSHEWSWEVVDFGTPENHPNHFHGLDNALAYGISLNPDWSQHSFLGYFDTQTPYHEKRVSFGENVQKVSTTTEDAENIYLHTYNKNYQKRDTEEVYYNYSFTINNTNYTTQGNILLNNTGEIINDNLLYETREYDTITIIPKRLLTQGSVKLTSLEVRADNWNLLSSLDVTPQGARVTREELLEMINNGEDVTHVDVSGITNMSRLFYFKTDFNQDISGWDVSHVTNMDSMFENALSFNQPIGDWDVSHVTRMDSMFRQAEKFNQPLENWDVSHVTTMDNMFANAMAFNQPIGNWNVSNVGYLLDLEWNRNYPVGMKNMFLGARAFNQPIGNWNVNNVRTMARMFEGALTFNQDISNWSVDNVLDSVNFSLNSPLQEEYKPHFINY